MKLFIIVVLVLNWWKGVVEKDDANIVEIRFELLKNQILEKLKFKIKKGEWGESAGMNQRKIRINKCLDK